jgi:hypothetical protein
MQTEAAHSSSSLCASRRAASPVRDSDLARAREIGVVLAGAGYQVTTMLHGVRRAAHEADVAVRIEGIDTARRQVGGGAPEPGTGHPPQLASAAFEC